MEEPLEEFLTSLMQDGSLKGMIVSDKQGLNLGSRGKCSPYLACHLTEITKLASKLSNNKKDVPTIAIDTSKSKILISSKEDVNFALENLIIVFKMSRKVGKYEIGDTLGEGAFGKVKQAKNSETGEFVAIKIMNKEKILRENMSDQIKKEISIMKSLKHKHVVKLLDVLVSKQRIYLVFELLTGGELFYKIANNGKFSEKVARFYFQQLISGLEFVHSQGICHRDLKPENILLDGDDNLKISDFGLSALKTDKEDVLQTACGTPNYVAPEVITGEGYDGQAADIWSCGIILFVFLAGYLPMDDPSLEVLFEMIKNVDIKYPNHFSKKVKNLLKKILHADPLKRATLQQIKEDPWFKVGLKSTNTTSRKYSVENVFGGGLVEESGGKKQDQGKKKILNAFDLIGMSGAFDMGRMLKPNPREQLKSYTRFTTSTEPEDALTQIQKYLETIPNTTVTQSKNSYKIKAEVRSREKYVLRFNVQIFSMSPKVHLVDFRKQRGNVFEFTEIYKTAQKKLKKLMKVHTFRK
ncbi:cbl-interacting protein kinase [Anaeramoeba flamelloides]|uniref:non-specific serine/threonine protein kinase n=1 Tax=Anaeramoeba flamelloides TaxID=1746091 RepID=A0AAV7YXC1_9EUKA|nr:cbl-interacting protein kinase [Anaeramoeba flamelloides]